MPQLLSTLLDALGGRRPWQNLPKRTMPGSHKITNELGCRLGEKCSRSGVLSPAACEKYAKEELNILQLIINGLQNKKIELVKLLQDQEVRIALLKETILPKQNNRNHHPRIH